jgi:hypothetical protein
MKLRDEYFDMLARGLIWVVCLSCLLASLLWVWSWYYPQPQGRVHHIYIHEQDDKADFTEYKSLDDEFVKAVDNAKEVK